MKLSEVLFSVHIPESLNTQIPFYWRSENGMLLGVGRLDDVDIELKISSLKYQEYNGCNLAFATYRDGAPVEVFRNEFGSFASKIFGAVVNGLKPKLDEYHVDFVCLVAKDNVEKRTTVYNLIAHRIARERLMHIKTFKHGDSNVIVMINNTVPSHVLGDVAALFDPAQ
jgi:hypothetical protein